MFFGKKEREGLDALKLGTVLQNPDKDDDPDLDGSQNMGTLPPIQINDAILVDVFYQAESKAGKKRKIEWLETKLTKTINISGGIAEDASTVILEEDLDLVVGDQYLIEEEIVELVTDANPVGILRGEHGTTAAAHPNGTKLTKIISSVPRNSLTLDGKKDPLPVPTGVTAIGAFGIITVRWDHYSGVNQKMLKHFHLWRSTFADPVVATLRDKVDTTVYVDNIGPDDPWDYWYWVSAVDTSGLETEKSESTEFSHASAVIDTAPPEIPTTIGTYLNAIANGMKLLLGIQAIGQTQTIVEAKLRLKKAYDTDVGADTLDLRTVAEGGAGPDSDLINIDSGIFATAYGARHTITVEIPGRYFYTWALRNSIGWSGWTDGHTLAEGPSAVPIAHSISTKNIVDSGPPQDWVVTTIPGETINTVRVKATKPKINGDTLLWWNVQVKNSGVGAWRALDENAGAAVTYYDGSAIGHKLNDGGTRLIRESGVGFGTANVGDLILLDVRGGAFHRNYCQWGAIQGFETGLPATSKWIKLEGGFRPQVTSNLRIKVVKFPHTWNTEGYLGDLPGHGQDWDYIPNDMSAEFVSRPIPVDADINSIDARVWFENEYCRSDATVATNAAPTFSTNAIKVKSRRDNVLPSKPLLFSVTTALGEFVGVWNDPAEGYSTLDDANVQYALDAAFTTGVKTATGLGHVNRATGYDPGQTYWFRVAVHNQSGLPSHGTTAGLGAEGWGPWSDVFGPITSAVDTGAPVDTVIPGLLVGLDVQGGGGRFVANWSDPLTGFLTIDDHAVEWATNPGFSVGVDRSKGWGDIHHLDSTLPGQTFYFRIAAHNQSGLPSHWSIASNPGYEYGWGPWTPYGAPNAVSSGGVPGAAIDTVIPGQVVITSATGGNGKFLIKWNDPPTGNLTIDDTAIAWSTNPAGAPPEQIAAGWGKRNVLESDKPNSSFYFWIAVHNQSNQPSAPVTAFLGATGWGPWCTPTALISSGIPLPAAEQISDSMVPNGGFELVVPGTSRPAGWFQIEGYIGAGGDWFVYPERKEGKQALAMVSNGTSQYGIASDAFPVQGGEKLMVSCWAISSGTNNNGFYFRMFFNSNNPDFIGGEAETSAVDIVSGGNPPSSWTRYEGKVTVPATAGWMRASVYNYGLLIPCNIHVDDVQVHRIAPGTEIQDNTLSPDKITGEGQTTFVETFETPLGDQWSVGGSDHGGAPAAAIDYPASGVDGGKVLQTNGRVFAAALAMKIPFDPRKLYRISTRIRVTQYTDAVNTNCYVGVAEFNSAGNLIDYCWCALYAFPGYGNWTGDIWYEYKGYFKGHGGYVLPAPDSMNPSALVVGTAYIAPAFVLNWPAAGIGAGNLVELDDIRIESVSETSDITAAALHDTIVSTQKLVDAAVSEVKIATSAITTTKISDNAISTPKLITFCVLADKIGANQVSADKISVANLAAIKVDAGNLTAGTIVGLTIKTGNSGARLEFDINGFRSYDFSGAEYLKIAPQGVGGSKLFCYEIRMHPNIGAGNSMVLGGHTDKVSHVLLQSADGTEMNNRSFVFCSHGAAGGAFSGGFTSLGSQHTERLRVHSGGLRLSAMTVAAYDHSTYPPNYAMTIVINDTTYYIPLRQA